MGYTGIVEDAADRWADAAHLGHLRAGSLPVVPVYERCSVDRCGWEGSDGVTLAEHLALAHPIDLPQLFLDGQPARASQYLRHTPNDQTFAVVGDAVLEYQVNADPWRTAGTSEELGAAMATNAGASDWRVSLRSSAHADLRINYQVRLRVLTDEGRRPVDVDFLRCFRHSYVTSADVLGFTAAWSDDVLQQDYAGALADCMQWLAARGMSEPDHRLGDAGAMIRRLSRYETSLTATMMCDVLRFCDMNVREPATQTALPSVTFALDWLHSIASSGIIDSPDVALLGGARADSATIFIDAATQDLLDRVVDLARETDPHHRGAHAADLVAWASAEGRLAADRKKAYAFAVAGAPLGTLERSDWAGALVHDPDLGEWASGVTNDEVGA